MDVNYRHFISNIAYLFIYLHIYLFIYLRKKHDFSKTNKSNHKTKTVVKLPQIERTFLISL